MIYQALINNITLIITLSILYGLIIHTWEAGSKPHRIFSGFLFGAVAVVGMMNPLVISPGLIFDGRSISISIAGLAGGWITALIAAAMSIAYRAYLGGPGAIMGVSVITASALIGVAYHHIRRKRPDMTGPQHLITFGILVHLCMLILTMTLPSSMKFAVLAKVAAPVIIIYPIGTFLVCLVLLEQESRILALKQLRRSEEKYRELVESANSIILRLDREGRITFFNSFAEEFFGFKAQDIIGRSAVGTIIPETETTGRDLAALIADLLANPAAYANNENENMRSNGERVWIAWANRPIFDSAGNLGEILCVGNDITNRRRAEEALRRSERRFRAIFDSAFQFTGLLTPDGRLIEANQALLDFAGAKLEDLTGRFLWETPCCRGNENRVKQLKEAVSRAARGDFVRYEVELTRTGDTSAIVDFSLKPVFGEGGEVALLLPEARDITLRRRAEEALEESRAKTRSILDNIGIGVTLISPAMEVLELNKRMRRWYPTVDPGERPRCFSVLPQPLRDEICDDCMVARTLKDGLVHEAAIEVRKKRGVRNYRIVSSPILNPSSGRVIAAIEMVEDITERLSLAAQLQQAQKLESVGRLAGGVAHDFNNMLSVIIGHTELAMSRVDPDEPLFADLREIRKAAGRSAELTQQLLAFARKQTVAPRVLDLNETVEGMLRMLRRLIGENIDLRWLPGAAMWPVRMDPSQIDQILANLCINARDAIGGNGRITIETNVKTFDDAYCADHPGFTAGDFVVLAVSDNGKGMDKETLGRIFEPFFTSKEIGRGTGLGLATVYGIVRQNDGFINVYSEPGSGTTFRIYLPRHGGESAEAVREAPSVPAERGNETILLVEDEPAILNLARMLLEGFGYRVLPAPTPGEAMRLAEEFAGKIHLLIADVVMPEMNGRELAANLTSRYPDLKRLFMSGYTADVIAHHGVLDQGVNFIQKPFSVQDLAAKVRDVLDGE